MWLALLLLWVAINGMGCSFGRQPAEAQKQDEGKKLFTANCATCHGSQGDRIPSSPLNSHQYLESRGDAILLAVVSGGKGVMPAFGKQRGGPLSDEQVRQVVAYLSANAGRSSPTLLADAGKDVYQKNCVKCHGEAGDRVPIAPLLTKGFLDSRADSDLFQSISAGKGNMPGLGQAERGPLKDDQVQAAVAFLRYRVDANVAEMAGLGRDLYMESCIGCHGEKGDRVQAVSLASQEFLQKLGDGRIISAINQGKGSMPGFGKETAGSFGIRETAAALTYLRTWAGFKATSAIAGPAPSGKGKDLFASNCAPCLGANGDKIASAPLMSSGYLKSQTDAVLLQTIARGNPKGMPAWAKSAGGPLDDPQIKSVLEYLTSSAGSSPTAGSGAATAASPTPAATAAASAEGLASKGKELYAGKCSACHGQKGDTLPTAKLADGAWLKERGDDALISSITNGKGGMPPWGQAKGGSLSADDIKALVAYLKQQAGVAGTASAPGATPASSGTTTSAKDIFAQKCAGCHGQKGDALPMAKLADAAWLKGRGDAALTNSIANGKGAMPAWSKSKGGTLSDDDVTALVAYMKEKAGP